MSQHSNDDMALPHITSTFIPSTSPDTNSNTFGRRIPQKSPSTPIPGPLATSSANSSPSSTKTSLANDINDINHLHKLPSLQLASDFDEHTILPLYSKSSSSESSSARSSPQSSPSKTKFFVPVGRRSSCFSLYSAKMTFKKYFSGRKQYPTPLILLFLLSGSIILYFWTLYKNQPWSQGINYSTKGFTYTSDPLIYPDLSSVFSSSKMKHTPNKAPGDHAVHMNDPEMVPAAAKGSLNSKDKDSTDTSTSGDNANNGDDQPPKAISNQNIPKLIFQPASFSSPLTANSAHSHPPVVLVLGINPEKYRAEYIERIISNRKRYAQKFGYGLYVRLVSDFKSLYLESASGNPSWTKLPILRAAMQAFPESQHFWYLDQDGLITDFSTSIEDKIINKDALEGVLRRNIPIVHNFDIIKTYKHTPAENMRLIITQNEHGVNPNSFILANNVGPVDRFQYPKVLLDLWGDPAYRHYHGFAERSEEAALDHLLLWHPTLLSRTAVVPARELAGLSAIKDGKKDILDKDEYLYNKGDTALILIQCEESSTMACMQELSENYV